MDPYCYKIRMETQLIGEKMDKFRSEGLFDNIISTLVNQNMYILFSLIIGQALILKVQGSSLASLTVVGLIFFRMTTFLTENLLSTKTHTLLRNSAGIRPVVYKDNRTICYADKIITSPFM